MRCTRCRIGSRDDSARVLALFLWCGATLAYGGDSVAPSSAEIERIAIVPGKAICIDVEVFGERRKGVIDTGASCLCLDESYQARLGKPIKREMVFTHSSSCEVAFHKRPEIKVGRKAEQTFSGPGQVGCIDLKFVREATEQDAIAIIGMDFLATQVLRIDVNQGYAALLRCSSEPNGHVERISYEKDRLNSPIIRLAVSDQGFHSFMIDTGSDGGVTLERKLFEKLVRKKRIVARGSTDTSELGGDATTENGILEELSVGPHRLRNLAVEQANGNKLGMDFLRRFVVELDFPNRRASFCPGPRFDTPDPWNLAGIELRRAEGRTMATHLSDRAKAAGLQENDVIVQVNGTRIEELSLAQVYDHFSESESDLRLEVSREDQIVRSVLRLQRDPCPFPEKGDQQGESVLPE